MNNTVHTLLIVIPVLLVSISIHESMHALAGLWLGDDTAKLEGRISLNPFKHVDPFLTLALPIVLAVLGSPIFGAAKPVMIDMRRVKYQEFGGAIIGIIGPLSNLVIASIAAFVLKSFVILQHGVALDILLMTISLNIGFFVFNCIPFPPLDGSRLLYAFAPEPLQRFMDYLEHLGLMALVLFMFVLFPIIQPLINNINSSIVSVLLR